MGDNHLRDMRTARPLYMFAGDTIRWQNGDKLYCLHVQADDMAESPRGWDGQITTMACWHQRYELGDKLNDKDAGEFWQRLVRETVPGSELLEKARNGDLYGIRISQNSENPSLVDVYETSYLSTILGRGEPEECLEYEAVSEGTAAAYLVDDLTVGHCMTLMAPYAAWLSLWIYDHSGITMSCSADANPYSDRWDSSRVGWIVAMKDTITEETRKENSWRAMAVKIMEADVAVYDAYLTGEVYGYTLYKADLPADDTETDSLVWEEIDSCYGFYGDDIMENGMCGNVGCGLADAIAGGEYEKGKAKRLLSAQVDVPTI